MNEKILTVDDEPDFLELLDTILTRQKFQAFKATGVAEAIDIFTSEPIDIVITDMRMPGIDGMELLEKVKQLDEFVEVIILTGFANIETAVQTLKNGRAFDYLTKPLENFDVLLIAVNKALEKRKLRLANQALLNELNQAKKDLERRVKDRTIELTKVNINLKHEIEQRLRAEKKLQKAHTELTIRVEERTLELEKTLKDLQSTQAQLLQSEKMASIGQLAAGVAHEINNPIGFVKSNLGTMNQYRQDLTILLAEYLTLENNLCDHAKPRNDALISKRLERIQKIKNEIDLEFIEADGAKVIKESMEGIERVVDIVSDLKNFAHLDGGELEYSDLNEGIESTLNIVWNELKYKAKVIKELGKIPLVKCYPQRLNQVFMNIFVNASQAIEDRGEIHISTRLIDGKVEIQTSDTGKGIPASNLSKIFDPFFTDKEVGKGTGLGLNVAYNIVQQHNGTIDVESKVGKGTTFIVRLPIDPELEPTEHELQPSVIQN